MTTIRREPTAATAAVALTVGASAVGRLVGAPVVPLSIFQPLAPVAGTVGRVAMDNAKRAGFVMLLVAAPMWGGFHGIGLDNPDDGGLLYEAPVAGLVIMMIAGYLLLMVRDAGLRSSRFARATESAGHRDAASSWVILTRGFFKRRRSSRIAGSQTGAAARAPRLFFFL